MDPSSVKPPDENPGLDDPLVAKDPAGFAGSADLLKW